MEMIFLGTGSAWAIPEHSCDCAICAKLKKEGEERTRTSLFFRGAHGLLIDCGPDIRSQMMKNNVDRPDAILITHEHADHFLGLDDLHAFRRSVPRDDWRPIPVYATEAAWLSIEVRFSYLVGQVIEKRIVAPGEDFTAAGARITPFKTNHGPSAPGSVGYCVEFTRESGSQKIVYTADFMSIPDEPSWLAHPDILVMQSHWFNEPEHNRPHHMSFQRAISYIKKWAPRTATYLVHISDGDQVPGDPANAYLKKMVPASPLAHPVTGIPYPVPRCRSEWQDVVNEVCKDYETPGPVIVPGDGTVVPLRQDL